MRLRLSYLPFVVAAGIGGLLISGSAQSQTPTPAIVAIDDAFQTSGGGAPSVTIAPGAMVGFSYPTGSSRHNVVFTGTQPSACTQTAGTSTGAVPPLPNPASGPGWAGQCTFATAGSYAFYCDVHTFMTGKVTVAALGGTPPPPPPPVPAPPPPSLPVPPPTGSGPAASGLRLSAVQRGFTLRGSVNVSRAGSRLLARAFAKRRSLSGGRSNAQVQVGRQLRQSVGGARVSFAVNLSAVARRALRRNGRLAITLRLTVTPPTGRAYTATRTVILRAPA